MPGRGAASHSRESDPGGFPSLRTPPMEHAVPRLATNLLWSGVEVLVMAHSIFRRLLVPHDLSRPADRALRLAAELAEAHDGDVLVLHVVAPFYPFADLPYGAQISLDVREIAQSAKEQLEARVAKVLRRSSVPVTCRVRIGEAFQQIMDAASGRSAIVMSTAGHTGLARLVIGSVTEKVVRHATVPVLTLHPGARAARRPTGKRKAASTRRS